MKVAGVSISHPARVVYTALGTTKGDLAQYYERIAPWMLPFVGGHVLSVVRCPRGAESKCFFQKHPPTPTPPGVHAVEIREKTKRDDYMVVEDAAGLVGLAQYGALEIHAWAARASAPEQPRRLIFDLDPGREVKFHQMVEAAHLARDALAEQDLDAYVMTTGGKGLHVVCPIEKASWEEASQFSANLAKRMEKAQPYRFTSNMRKTERTKRVFIDYLRNTRGATSIVPYSSRARPGAPVATPVSWQELDRISDPQHYTIDNIFRRLSALDRDPWEGFDNPGQLDSSHAAQ